MAYLIATDKPLLWAASYNGNIFISDTAEVGGKIGIPPTLTEYHDTDPNAFLGKVTTSAGTYNPIPAVGEWCEGGKIYGYNGGLVICRQSHYRTVYPLADTPALWSIYRPGNGVMDWVANEPVLVGTHRMYAGTEYICLQAHVTQADWTPDKTTTLWGTVAPATGAWTVGVAYKMGDLVTYQGSTYKCLQAHTSIATWTPTAAVSLWKKQ